MLRNSTSGPDAAEAPTPARAGNPLLAPWIGPAGGVPPFDQVQVAHFKPALEAAMAENLAEIDAIARNPASPEFDNTIAALERSGRTFSRVNAVYSVWSSTMSTEDFQAVERELQPKLAAFADKISQNAALFARIAAVYAARESLTPVQQRLCWFYHTNFVRAGAKLDAAAKRRVGQINERLATLFANFSQNLLADEGGHALYLKSEQDLEGLPAPLRAAARSAAAARGHADEWAILNTRSSMDPFLTYADRRDLREQVWRSYYSRGDNGDAHDNKKIISEILALRAQRAKLLGFPTHAHWRVADSMAKTPEAAMSLMMQVWPAAVAREHEEVADMQAIADREHPGVKIAGWDYRYYAEKVRKAKHDLDMNEVKPYLQLEKLREGMFWAAGRLYGFSFTQVSGFPVANPDVRVWRVTSAAQKHVGFWYFDPYARSGKNSGAWMSEYRGQEKLDGDVAPIVSNNTNFVKDESGGPLLISWDDAVTLFHEFGHALHGLNSDVIYPSLAGTNVVRDFVEFPSQLNENWLSTPEVLSRFAVHHQTGEPIPPALVAKIKKASTFNQGFATVEYLASALVDMKLHLTGDAPIDVAEFERSTLAALGMPGEMVMRHRTPQFAHIFSSDAYSAGYYGYLWAEVLDHDAFEAFIEAGGPYDAAVAKRLHDDIMSVGNGVDPGEAYRNFRGSDPKIDGLLRARGFAPPGQQTE
ncbi:MAG TPA: M3 family metallopeptidase [Steroidobacteraceae bacterium]|nr:M3 family metallopeptidase [Steroidobacteraceae bacterium]